MLISDRELILAFQQGDESAFVSLVDRYRTRVVNTAYRFLADRDSAQDVAQEVFIRIYTSAKSYRPDAAFTTWLYRITANACLDEIRKRKRSRTDPSSSLSEYVLDPDASPEEHARTAELAREVRSAIAALPESQRLAVILQRYEGLSYQQIADVLKTSLPAVESLIFRAKQSLRARLSVYVDDNRAEEEASAPKEKIEVRRKL